MVESRCAPDLPSPLPKHFQYRLGVITETDEQRTTIDFDIHGMKKFVTCLMVAEPAEGVPPKRPRAKRRKEANVHTQFCRNPDRCQMNNGVIVQYVGFEAKLLAREYTFNVREADNEREFTLNICALRLQAEVAAYLNHPPEHTTRSWRRIG